MFKRSDQEFLAVLEDDEKLEKRIIELTSIRKMCTIAIVPMMLLIFWLGFTMLSEIIQTSGKLNPATSWHVGGIINSIFTSACLAVCLSKAFSAHSELRTLLLFKKLRDDKSVVTP